MQNFNYHSHTYRCGNAALVEDEEYVKEYIKNGFKKIAFTDHCPEKNVIDERPNVRMAYNEKEEYLKNINALKEKYKDKIEIQVGYEVEYAPGNEENIRELKEETDKIILGQHFILDENGKMKSIHDDTFSKEDKLKYARYIEKAIELGIPDIIAHPDIYMNNNDEFSQTEENVANIICKAAEKYDIPLEINLNRIFNNTYYKNRELNNDSLEEQKERLSNIGYPCKKFWEIASNYNIRVLYGIDVHRVGQISQYKNLITLANMVIGQDTIDKLNFISNEDTL